MTQANAENLIVWPRRQNRMFRATAGAPSVLSGRVLGDDWGNCPGQGSCAGFAEYR